MELDVTHMVEDCDDMPMMSGSIAELGANAPKITWNNSVAYGAMHPLLTTDDMKDEARAYFAGFGAWSREDIAAWSEAELQGIMCQDVAGAIREMEACESPEDYEKRCEAGTCSGNLHRSADKWYFYVGS